MIRGNLPDYSGAKGKTGSDRWTDEEFMAWCDAEKPCKYCSKSFIGPSCKCESMR